MDIVRHSCPLMDIDLSHLVLLNIVKNYHLLFIFCRIPLNIIRMGSFSPVVCVAFFCRVTLYYNNLRLFVSLFLCLSVR